MSDVVDFKIEIQQYEEDCVPGEFHCDKNNEEQHALYIPFKDLKASDLAPYNNKDLLKYIKYMGNRAVRINVYNQRGQLEKHATGFICKRDNQVYVVTNKHVVGVEDDPANCTIDFDYLDEYRKGTITTCGTEIRHVSANRDYSQIHFDLDPVRDITDGILDLWRYNVWVKFPGAEVEEKHYLLKLGDQFVLQTKALLDYKDLPHDPIQVVFNDDSISYVDGFCRRTTQYDYVTFDPVPTWVEQYEEAILPVVNVTGEGPTLVVVISHPHGLPKRVAIGEQLDETNNGYTLYHSAITCDGSSGSPVFRIGITDIGKFPRTMLFTHFEGGIAYQYKSKELPHGNCNRATLNTRRPIKRQ